MPVEVKKMAKILRKDGKDSSFVLSTVQKRGVAFLLNKGAGLLGWGVGVGKTFGLMSATVANMDRGRTKRPAFICPKSTIDQTWIASIQAAFPTKTVVNLGGLQQDVIAKLKKERGDDPKNWIKDGEISIISHEGIMRLGFTPEEFVDLTKDLEDALWTEGKDDNTARAEEKQKAKLQEALGEATKFSSDILFSDLGIDHLSVDEVHNFRNIFTKANVEKDSVGNKKRFTDVGGGGTPAIRAKMLFLISQQVQKNTGGNIFLASATPFENHPTEMYNIMSLMARSKMREMGLYNINDFFASFANFETELDKDIKGDWKPKQKMKGWKNLKALQQFLREFIDKREDPTLVRPEKRMHTPVLSMSAKQEENSARIQALAKNTNLPGALLKACTYAKANSVSPYFIKEYNTEPFTKEELVENSPKLKYFADFAAHMQKSAKTKNYGTFAYLGDEGVKHHQSIASYIVENCGYTKEQVAVLNGETTPDERNRIKAEFNNGTIKVLLGGSPTKEGIDLQKNGYTTLILTLDWNPTVAIQVMGRVWRQGNFRNIAPVVIPLLENSADAMIYGKYEEKGGRINDAFSYTDGEEIEVGDISAAEQKLALLTDPKDKATVEIEYERAKIDEERLGALTEQKNLEAMRSDIKSSVTDKEYWEQKLAEYEEYKERDLNKWGSIARTDEDRERLKEAIKSSKEEVKKAVQLGERMQKNLEKKGIIDLDAKISEFGDKIGELKIKTDEIKNTYDERFARFSQLRKIEIENKKTTSDHLADFDEMTKDLKEHTEGEIATKKTVLKKEDERRQALEQAKMDDIDRSLQGGYIRPGEIVKDVTNVIQRMIERKEFNTDDNKIRRDISLFSKIMKDTNEIYLTDPNEFQAAHFIEMVGDSQVAEKAILDTKFAELLKPFFALSNKEQENLMDVLYQGDADKKKYSVTQLKSKGLKTPAEIAGYYQVRKAFETAHDTIVEMAKEKGVDAETLKEFEASHIGYMPHKWEGKFVVKIYDSGKLVEMTDYKTQEQAQIAKRNFEKDNNNPAITYSLDTLQNISTNFFIENGYSADSIKRVIESAKVPEEIKKQVTSAMKDMIKSKGFAQHFIRRRNIKGYERGIEAKNAMVNYFGGMTGYISKTHATPKYFQALRLIDPAKQPTLEKWAHGTVLYQMSNDNEWNEIKNVAFVVNLGGNIASMLTNSTQNLTVGIGELSKLTSGTGKIAGAEIALAKATAQWLSGKGITAEERTEIESLMTAGQLGAGLTSELMGFKGNPIYKGVSNVVNKAVYGSYAWVEININRVPSYLAALRLSQESGMSFKEASEKALEVSKEINVRSGKYNRAEMNRGKVGNLFFTFTAFVRHMIFNLAYDMKHGEFVSFSKKMFYTLLLGGASALPLAGLFTFVYQETLKKVFGGGDDEDKKDLTQMQIAMEKGIPAAFADMDMSNRVGIDIIALNKLFSSIQQGKAPSVLDSLGAVGSVLNRLWQGISQIEQTRYEEALSKILPNVLGNPIDAYYGSRYGVRTYSGSDLKTSEGEVYKYSTYEAIVKSFGITPTSESLLWDQRVADASLQNEKAKVGALNKKIIEEKLRKGDVSGAQAMEQKLRDTGVLTAGKSYIDSQVLDKVIRTKITAGVTNTQQTVNEVIKEVYGDRVITAQKKTDIKKEINMRKVFGYSNQLANDIARTQINADKVDFLIKSGLSQPELSDFINKAYAVGLISQATRALYIKTKNGG